MGLLLFSFQILHLAATTFISKIWKLFDMIFELAGGKKLLMNIKDNRVFISRIYLADSCP